MFIQIAAPSILSDGDTSEVSVHETLWALGIEKTKQNMSSLYAAITAGSLWIIID